MSTVDRKAEIAQLVALYGAPIRQRCILDVSPASHAWWSMDKARHRNGEVILFILRRNRKLILHTRDFYPGGVMRVPSGGIKPGEAVTAAVHREALEETGLQVSIERFLTLVGFEFHWQEKVVRYPSYGFLLREMAGDLQTLDPGERIAAFNRVPLSELLSIAQGLRRTGQRLLRWLWQLAVHAAQMEEPQLSGEPLDAHQAPLCAEPALSQSSARSSA